MTNLREDVAAARRHYSQENLPNTIVGRAMLRFASDTDRMISVEELMKHVFQRDMEAAAAGAEEQIDGFCEAVGIPAEDFKHYVLYNAIQQNGMLSAIPDDLPDKEIEAHVLASLMAPVPAHVFVGMYVQQELTKQRAGEIAHAVAEALERHSPVGAAYGEDERKVIRVAVEEAL